MEVQKANKQNRRMLVFLIRYANSEKKKRKSNETITARTKENNYGND